MNRVKDILLVEDNPDDVELTRLALQGSNIANALVVARDGVEALDYLFGTGAYAGRDIRDLPALVLLDLNLPRINGLDVLQRIRESAETRLIPVVVMTTSNEEQDRITSYTNGANSYLRKPVDFDNFLEAVKQLGLYWLLLNQTAYS